MNHGPWTTALGARSKLGAAWIRRMTLLKWTKKAGPSLQTPDRLRLMFIMVVVFSIPIFRVVPTTAQDAHEPATKPAGDSQDSFRVELPGGVTAELLGIGEHATANSVWWSANGTRTAAPYARFTGHVRTGSSEMTREIALRWMTIPEGSSVRWSVSADPAARWWLAPTATGTAAGGKPLGANGERIHGIDAMAYAFPAEAKTCTVILSIASGDWQTHAESDGSSAETQATLGYAFAFSPASMRDGKVMISITHNLPNQDVRITAIDRKGKEIVGFCEGTGGHGFQQMTAMFPGTEIGEIATFRIQSRGIVEAKIRNVSLLAGRRTDPVVIAGH